MPKKSVTEIMKEFDRDEAAVTVDISALLQFSMMEPESLLSGDRMQFIAAAIDGLSGSPDIYLHPPSPFEVIECEDCGNVHDDSLLNVYKIVGTEEEDGLRMVAIAVRCLLADDIFVPEFEIQAIMSDDSVPAIRVVMREINDFGELMNDPSSVTDMRRIGQLKLALIGYFWPLVLAILTADSDSQANAPGTPTIQ
jgi:hypothetical protein